jgi:putative pyoverdin transport system ATP-binding/permease protein
MKLILFFLKYSPRYLTVASVMGAISGISATVLMIVINSRLSGPPSKWNSAWTFSAIVVVVLVTNFFTRTVMSHLSQWSLFNLRMSLSRLIVSCPLRTIENAGAHKVLVALAHDVDDVARVLQTIPVTFVDAAVLMAAFVYMAWLNWGMFIIFMVALALAVFTSKIPEFKAEKKYAKSREYWEEMIGNFRSITDGLKELKLHVARRGAFFAGPLQSSLSSYRRLRFEGDRLFAWARAWGIVMFLALLGIVLYTLPKMGVYNSHVIFGYIIALMYLKTPLDRLQDNVPTYQEGKHAMEHINSLGLGMEQIGEAMAAIGKEQRFTFKLAEPDSLARVRQPKTSFQLLELVGVTHKYYREQDEREFELGEINLTVYTGEMIFLVGGNGSGKTTLAKLLVGLYRPESGQISLDSEEISKDNHEWYSQHFSVVFSDFFLFESLLGLETPARNLDARAYEYLVQLRLDHKVQVKDGVLSTTKLSQGQRKRLALLTAFLEDRPIYLFDEWAADQDPIFKKVFYHQLLPELKSRGKTVIVISHDDHYYYMADRIVKLVNGKIDSVEKPIHRVANMVSAEAV